MRIMLIGANADIRRTLHERFITAPSVELRVIDYDQFSSLDCSGPTAPHLIIASIETPEQGVIFERVLGDPSYRKQIPLVVVACSPSGSQVLKWLQMGSSAVELWPCQSSRIGFLVDYLTVRHRMENQRPALRSTGCDGVAAASDPIVFASRAMQQLRDKIDRIAPLKVNVLLSGETGVGKTRVAQLLHEGSLRRNEPFFAVNCAALPEELIESELFGHTRGAFTGADSERTGRFEDVGRGTLFLDEVDSIPFSSQCKLLRGIENRVFEPLGANRSVEFRGRIVAASNTNLENLVRNGRFRADLYYRLGVVELYISPLRDRVEDIRPIACAVLKTYCSINNLAVTSISEEVFELLEACSWPGNVRQLRNLIESSASLCRGEQIEVADLSERWLRDICKPRVMGTDCTSIRPRNEFDSTGASNSVPPDCSSLSQIRDRAESDRIKRALVAVGYNRTKAAIQLGISRTMLYKKLAKYGLADLQ